MRKIKPVSSPFQLDLFSSYDSDFIVINDPLHNLIPSSIEKSKNKVDNKRIIALGSHKIEYEFRRSKKRSIGFLIDEKGLRVSAPEWVSIREVEKAIKEKENWIIQKLYYFLYKYEKPEKSYAELKDGVVIPYLGENITLRLSQNEIQQTYLNEHNRELIISLKNIEDIKQVQKCLKYWFQGQAHRIFSERMPGYAKLIGVRYQSVSISSAKQQWGSCTVEGKIRLNWRLIHFSFSLIDYVIVHELAHLREMNHSKRFWNIVAAVYPDYMQAKKQLNQKNLYLINFF